MLLLFSYVMDPAEACLACSSSKFCLDCTRPPKIKMRNDLMELPMALGFTRYQTRTGERANEITDCELAKVEEEKSTNKIERRRKINEKLGNLGSN